MSETATLLRVRRLAKAGEWRRLRIEAGLSLREVADAVGVDAGTLLRWERGDCRPRRGHALAWAAVLDEIASALSEATGVRR